MKAGGFTIDAHLDLAVVERSWRELELSGVCCPYQRFDWISGYVSVLPGEDRPRTCVLSIRNESGKLALVLPLMIAARNHVRIASPPGGKHANYFCPVMARGAAASLDPETTRQLLRKAGAQLGIDVFMFRNALLAWAGEPNPMVLPGASPSPSNAPKTALTPDPDALLNKMGSSESRRKLRRKEAGLAALGELTHCVARSPGEVDDILDAFFRQKGQRFRELGIANPFDESWRRFIRTTCVAGLDHGNPTLELHGLLLDGRVIATCGGAVDAQRFSCMFNSFDPSAHLARFSPGDILLTRVIRFQCGLGRTMLDLGVGEARYKRHFCMDREELVDVLMPVTPKGHLYGFALKQLLNAKRGVKHSPSLWSLVQVLRSQSAKLGRYTRRDL
ncbi:MAG TPA: GNAT family N-acetyltransferase [Beijerinckiaceae bacterium]|jgi:CelD/BcsL family acetyltransferase involved in cellulose biosynthesis